MQKLVLFQRWPISFYSEETYGNNGGSTNIGETSTGSSVLVGEYVTIMDAVRLASGASGTDDAYNNYFIKFKIHSEDGSITEETRTIIDYDGANKVAKLNSALSIAPAQKMILMKFIQDCPMFV